MGKVRRVMMASKTTPSQKYKSAGLSKDPCENLKTHLRTKPPRVDVTGPLRGECGKCVVGQRLQ